MTSSHDAGNWERISDFVDRAEFDRCVEWLEGQVAAGVATAVPVTRRYVGATVLPERWYRRERSAKVWRLVWPDPPFRGVFEPVD